MNILRRLFPNRRSSIVQPSLDQPRTSKGPDLNQPGVINTAPGVYLIPCDPCPGDTPLQPGEQNYKVIDLDTFSYSNALGYGGAPGE